MGENTEGLELLNRPQDIKRSSFFSGFFQLRWLRFLTVTNTQWVDCIQHTDNEVRFLDFPLLESGPELQCR